MWRVKARPAQINTNSANALHYLREMIRISAHSCTPLWQTLVLLSSVCQPHSITRWDLTRMRCCMPTKFGEEGKSLRFHFH